MFGNTIGQLNYSAKSKRAVFWYISREMKTLLLKVSVRFSKIFFVVFLETNTISQQRRIKLIESDSKDFYNDF